MIPDDLGELAEAPAACCVLGPQVVSYSARGADRQNGDEPDQPNPETILRQAMSGVIHYRPPPRLATG
jgi:hypothetical protein